MRLSKYLPADEGETNLVSVRDSLASCYWKVRLPAIGQFDSFVSPENFRFHRFIS